MLQAAFEQHLFFKIEIRVFWVYHDSLCLRCFDFEDLWIHDTFNTVEIGIGVTGDIYLLYKIVLETQQRKLRIKNELRVVVIASALDDM